MIEKPASPWWSEAGLSLCGYSVSEAVIIFL